MIFWGNFEILLEVFIPNTPRNHCITYTNWRPISLANVDAKIASKAIATRIVKVLPEIIHSNQTGYVPGRYIGEAAKSILNMMDYTKFYNIPGMLLFYRL